MDKIRIGLYYFFILLSFAVFSQQTIYFLDGGIQYRTLNGTDCEVTRRIDGIPYGEPTIEIPMTAYCDVDDFNYNVVAIGDSAFYGATTTTVELHTSIMQIGRYAFGGTTGLNIISPSLIPPSITPYTFINSTTPIVYIHCNAYRMYEDHDYWGSEACTLKGIEGNTTIQHDTIVCVGENTFQLYNPYLDTITTIQRLIYQTTTFTIESRMVPIEGCFITDSLFVEVFPDGSYNERTIYLCSEDNYQATLNIPEHDFSIPLNENSVGVNTYSFPNGNCSDIYKITVNLVTSQRGNETIHKCQGEEYFYVDENGTNRLTTTNVTYTKRANNSFSGCDSLVNVNVIFHDTVYNETNQAICEGSNYRWYRNGYDENGNYTNHSDLYNVAGTYTELLRTSEGCTKRDVLNLTVNPKDTVEIYDTICFGENYERNGFNVPKSQMSNTLRTITKTNRNNNIYGCDSITILNLLVKPNTTTNLGTVNLCRDSIYYLNNLAITASGTHRDTLSTYLGCDSVVRVTISLRDNVETNSTQRICQGQSYIWQYSGYERNENGALVYRTITDTLTQAGTYSKSNLLTSYGCGNKANINLVINPTYHDTIYDNICYGTPYNGNGFNIPVSQMTNAHSTITRTRNLTSSWGCDSLITLVLNVNPTYTTQIYDTIVEGNTYNFFGQNLTQTGRYSHLLNTIDGCDSTIYLNLFVHLHSVTQINAAICQGETYNANGFSQSEAGTYSDTLTSYTGADSIVVLNLSVNPVYNDTITAEICQGQTYNLYNFNENETGVYTHQGSSIYGCDSVFVLNLTVNPIYDTLFSAEILEGQIYNFNGRELTVSGTYYDTLQTVNGCDSTFVLNLVVHPNLQTQINAEICFGEMYSENNFTESESGTYYQNLQTIHGADSTVILNLVVHPIYNDTLEVEICEGETYTQYGFNESLSGVYTHQGSSIYGCDSLFSINLSVNPIYNDTINAEICQGQTYTQYNFNINTQGIYTQRLQSVKGCDSLFSVNLIVNQIYDTLIVDSICKGSTYTLNGFEVSEAGYYTQNLTSIKGCDSIVNLNLSTVDFIDTIYADICEGQTYNQNNFNENTTGIYVDSLQAFWGCDSVIVLNLTVHPIYNDTIYAETCDNVPYTQNGFYADTTGIYTQYLESYWGCDSIVNLNLTVHPTYIFPLNEEICEGEVYIEHGFWLTAPGTYTMSEYSSCHGCDSLYVLNLTVNQTWDKLVMANICEGDTFRYEGYENIVAWESGTYRDTIPTYKGCDSAKTVMLTVNPVYRDTIYAKICEGGVYNLNGFNETQAGIYTQVLYSSMGCDSVVVLSLETGNSYHIVRDEEICQGEEFFFHDEMLSEEGHYIKELTSVYGCDSIVELNLRVNSVYHDTIYRRVCTGSTYSDENFTESQEGIYTIRYTSSKGCDSTLSLVLSEIYHNDTILAVVCEGETYSDNGFNESQTGFYTLNLNTFDGCDSIVNLDLYIAPHYRETIQELMRAGQTYDKYNFFETESGTYVQNLVSQYGCDSIVVLNLELYGDMLVFVPNAFTPQDRTNNLWRAVPEDETVILDELHIFNRYGALIFSATDFSQSWDGKYKGNYVQMGVYPYIIIYHSIYTPDKKERIKGSINVIY
ncbi:MAG: gliding motility-associated C-terminal domain-containing protein [Bacteroidales bacterium]|nr:gliding motility-associated C-terminal domain-containing protein [Bacteroidales bacterium]